MPSRPAPFETTTQLSAERRRHPRASARGVVRLLFDDPAPIELKAELLDVSQSGFRVSHESPKLRTGQEVSFAHARAEGRARVIWNRIQDGAIQSGFVIL